MIFISHSSKDKAAAQDVQRRLLGYGYDKSQLFLDSDAETGIPSGSKWEQELYARLERLSCAYRSLFRELAGVQVVLRRIGFRQGDG